jgi:hypothetical protein
VRQKKSGRPVKFELTDHTRQAVDDYPKVAGKKAGEFLFASRRGIEQRMTTRQYARLVSEWVANIGLDPKLFGTHSLRRTKATLIYRRTGNLRAVQLLLGHTKIESTVRYLGIEVDDALSIAEQVVARNARAERTSSARPLLAAKCHELRSPALFDHLVGCDQEARRYRKAERFRCLEIYDGGILGGTLHRQISGLLAAENTIDIRCSLPKWFNQVSDPVGQQTSVDSVNTFRIHRG